MESWSIRRRAFGLASVGLVAGAAAVVACSVALTLVLVNGDRRPPITRRP